MKKFLEECIKLEIEDFTQDFTMVDDLHTEAFMGAIEEVNSYLNRLVDEFNDNPMLKRDMEEMYFNVRSWDVKRIKEEDIQDLNETGFGQYAELINIGEWGVFDDEVIYPVDQFYKCINKEFTDVFDVVLDLFIQKLHKLKNANEGILKPKG